MKRTKDVNNLVKMKIWFDENDTENHRLNKFLLNDKILNSTKCFKILEHGIKKNYKILTWPGHF